MVRVPAYSPHAVAEHTLALILSLNRKVHRAYARVREGNFALEGLLGFDLHGRTAGVIGTGKIGALVANILRGFGCRVLATDQIVNSTCVAAGVEYVALDELLAESHLVTLHCPLTSATHHLLNAAAFARMRPGAMVINTSRGALLDASAAIDALTCSRNPRRWRAGRCAARTPLLVLGGRASGIVGRCVSSSSAPNPTIRRS